MKRVFDFFMASAGLVVLSPLLLAIGCFVKASSPGGVFYRGTRVGRHGKDFRIFKFRSMVANAESLGGSSTADGDARVTPIGQFMRKFKIDELPQLLNVIRGEMSFVGPRPEVREYVDLYSGEECQLLDIRPGITDWASIWNSDEGAILAGAADPDEAYLTHIRPTKIKLQLKYLHEVSLWTDIKILCYTLIRILRKGWVPSELNDYPPLTPIKQTRVLSEQAA